MAAAANEQQVKFSIVHANSWPPHAAVPGTCPLTIGGDVLEIYPLRVNPLAQAAVVGLGSISNEDPVSYVAIRLKVKSYLRCPAEGEISDVKIINQLMYKKNIDAFLEYLLGDVVSDDVGAIPHIWTGDNEWVFWVSPAVLKSEPTCKVGATVLFTTFCSTPCIAYWGEYLSKIQPGGVAAVGAQPASGFKVDKSKIITKKLGKKVEKDDDGWD